MKDEFIVRLKSILKTYSLNTRADFVKIIVQNTVLTKEDNGCSFGALVTSLSKAFECLPHEHVIVELDCHVYEVSSLRLILGFLLNI